MGWNCRILPEACTGCGICVDVCAHHALRMYGDMALPEPVPGACTGCMGCERECPFDAIAMVLETEPTPA